MRAQPTAREPAESSAIGAPTGPWLWSQSWRDLLFCHWRVPAALLERLLPEPLEVDTWLGSGWVSAVAFRLAGVRRRWLPPCPPLSSFLELNLRTYVVYQGELKRSDTARPRW